MFCKYCGSDKFTAHQICRMDIIVDGSGDFLGNISDDIASDIYDHEQPYGPFQCCGCGTEYDGDNIENAVEISGPAPNWPVPKVEKSHNLHLMTIPQLAEYIASQLNYSYIWKSKFPDCDFGIADIVEMKQYSQEELECIHSRVSSAPKVLIDCNTEDEAISTGSEAAMVRHLLAEDVVSKEKYETMKADRDSWKEAFGESNEKFAVEVQRRKNVERENQRLLAIIAQHLPGDTVCAHCEHFHQCKHEAVTLSEHLEKENSLFWTCDGYSHFVPKETL